MLYLTRAALAIAAGSSSTSTDSSPSPEGLDLLSQTRQLFRSLATESPRAKVERGYLLGQLEIARELRLRGWEAGTPSLPRPCGSSALLTLPPFTVDDLLALVKEYLERFGSKACCFDDLHPYLEILSDAETTDLHELLSEASEAELKVRSLARTRKLERS